MTHELASEYVRARSVLLDAMEAIGPHRAAVVLVGAQAVYLHAGEAELAVAPKTTDSDFALRVDVLADEPELATALTDAGFVPGRQPGSWLGRGDIAVDLMVVPHQSGRHKPTARAASLPPHDKRVARITRGLEAALIDHTTHDIGALDGQDSRSFTIQVAGPAALVVAKLIKLEERHTDASEGRRNRVQSKDAVDIFRLLRGIEMETLVSGFGQHDQDEHAAQASAMAVDFLRRESGTPDRLLPRLVSSDIGDDPTISASFIALAGELLAALDR